MIPFASFIIVFSALIGVGAACAAVGQACFRRRSDDVSTRLAVLWSVASIGLSIVVPALDGFQASKTAAIASAALLAATALASFFLSRYWREAAMKREAERLQLAKSGYADSQLADPEVPQEPDIEASAPRPPAPTTSPAAKRMCCASSLKGARHRKSPRSSSSRPTP